jgi:hypothetical protein
MSQLLIYQRVRRCANLLWFDLVTALEKIDKELMMSAQETTANTTNIKHSTRRGQLSPRGF